MDSKTVAPLILLLLNSSKIDESSSGLWITANSAFILRTPPEARLSITTITIHQSNSKLKYDFPLAGKRISPRKYKVKVLHRTEGFAVTKYLKGLTISIILLIASIVAESAGLGFFYISATHTLSGFLTIVFTVMATYYGILSLTIFSVRRRQGMPGEVKMLEGLYRVLAFFGLLAGFVYAQGKLAVFSSFFSLFGGMLLGWSLQGPVSGVAAWVLVTLKRPFRIGDRVQFPSLGLTGDVMQLTAMYTTLNQVGGAIGSEEAVGRSILIPNAMLFSNVVINYTAQKETSYILDEVVIRITYDSDWDTAVQILTEAAREVTADIIKDTGQKPYVRADNYDYGVYMRLRYITLATDRPRISSLILERVFKRFQENKNVDFAIPYVYSFKRGKFATESHSVFSDRHPESIPVESITDRLELLAELEQDPESVLPLARNIADKGLLQPVIVVRNLGEDTYTLIAGHQRLKACLYLGWETVPAIVQNPIGSEVQPFRSRRLSTHPAPGQPLGM